jgi:hypothetical protein
MNLNVPYLPDRAYTDFLAAHARALDGVYFSLPQGPALDARVRTTGSGPDLDLLHRGLSRLRGPARYLNLNTRFLRPDLYADPVFLSSVLESLEALRGMGCLDGILFTDFYFLTCLSREGGSFLDGVQAVPGVNAMLDCPGRVRACMDLIRDTRFRLPEKLCLDRSLNRDIPSLERTVLFLRREFPGVRVELLANEGCLYQCPFKPAHDAHIALSNSGLVRESTHALNRDAGCMSHLVRHPERVFKSPFIRPEDAHRYQGLADTLKLCGRTLGPAFLERAVRAYLEGSFRGNLLGLLDAMEWMSDRFHVDNTLLGRDFFKTLTNCSKDCTVCTICTTLFSQTTKPKTPGFGRYEEGSCAYW